ncbi:MAG TPA: tetratricopeptide repeat protein [Candidatus Sulfotelmatobacter sp.]|jgi:tetratricopeptide (TPR) repeat protein|nr:tetratricopeptide repeat protein [Candidatus Sulfotelmatobacter sp.]
MRFCPQCGAPLLAGAKFCVECGRALDVAAPGAGETVRIGAANRGRNSITTAFVFVFVLITIVGLGAAAWIYEKTPEAVREQVATAPPSAPAPGAGAPAASPASNAPASDQNAAANPAAGGSQNGGLPPGHPTVELPTEARSFVDKIERDANARPKDVVAWNKFGAVAMRAAMFDQTYYGKAQDAYGHVLKLDPDNLDALRGIGDIDYDKQLYDEAIAAYEHYLKKKPDDPEVRTDLGTMYLYTGNADQAVVQYKKAIASKPGFFQAYYNMGIAYAQVNQADEAAATLKQALAFAPDDTARDQVKQLIAKLNGAPAAGASNQAASASTASAQKQAAAAKSPAAASSSGASVAMAKASPAAPASAEDDFHDAVEEMIRGLPIAGPKVTSVEWPDKLKAKVFMDNFPMDQMPPFAKTKFETDLKAGIDTAKKDNKIASPVEVNIVDSASGKVMETITQ